MSRFGDNLEVFEVGGFIRDKFMGHLPTHTSDLDFAVETESFSVMTTELEGLGFTIFKSDPEYVTLRAQFPRNDDWAKWLVIRNLNPRLTADFVLCRKDGVYKDGRHPETVAKGNILDDLNRRDFTVNAIAMKVDTQEVFDPHDGTQDCVDGILRFVGNPHRRIEEDGLRVLRGLRFMVTHDLTPSSETMAVLHSGESRNAVTRQHGERVFEELRKMFQHDTAKSIRILTEFYMIETLFGSVGRHQNQFKLWLLPTMKERS